MNNKNMIILIPLAALFFLTISGNYRGADIFANAIIVLFGTPPIVKCLQVCFRETRLATVMLVNSKKPPKRETAKRSEPALRRNQKGSRSNRQGK